MTLLGGVSQDCKEKQLKRTVIKWLRRKLNQARRKKNILQVLDADGVGVELLGLGLCASTCFQK